MDTFDETLQKAKNIFNTARKKTGEAVNVQKLRFDLSSLEGKIDKLYTSLGKLRFSEMNGCEIDNDEVNAIVEEIKEMSLKSEELKAQISELTGKTNCPICGASLPSDARFCSSCGNKITEE